MSTYHLLDKAERLELLAEAFYSALAPRFTGPTRTLFERLAAEEGQHAARVRLLVARYRQDSRLMDAMNVASPQLDRLLVEAQDALDAVLAGAWDGNAEAALRGAAALERRFCVVHADALARDAHPSLRAFFSALAGQDKAHLELLGG